MPTIYTEDPVAKAVGDHALGQMGVQTGSVANSIGYSDYQRRHSAASSSSSSSGMSAPGGVAGPPYEPFAFIQTLEDIIPRWLLIALGLLAASLALVLGAHHGVLPSLWVAGAPNWAGIVGTGFVALAGFVAGAIAIPLALRLLDIGLKLLLLGLKLALAAGVIYLILWLLGAFS